MAKQLETKISLTKFGKAMGQNNRSNVPPEKRMSAVMDNMMESQGNVVRDRQMAGLIRTAQRLHHNKASQYDGKIIVPPHIKKEH